MYNLCLLVWKNIYNHSFQGISLGEEKQTFLYE